MKGLYNIMKENKLSTILNVAFVVLVLVGLVVYMIVVDGVQNTISTLKNVDYSWIIIGLVLTVLYWLLEGMCFQAITKKIYKKQRFISSFRLAIIGRLFNNITPMSCGDQPAQLLVMKQEGKTISNGASILLGRFIVYQIVLVIYTLIVMFLKYTYFKDIVNNFIYLALIGFGINAIVVTFLIAVAINETIVFEMIKFFLVILGKLRIIKDVEGKVAKLKGMISDFRDQLRMMKKEKFMIFRVALYTAIEITVLYSITYAVYRALGHNEHSFLTIISAQTLLNLVTVYMPTPGGSVAAEGGFYVVFNTLFAANTMNMSILFWRIYTFYLPIIVGTIFLIYKPKVEKEDQPKEVVEPEKVIVESEKN